MAKKVIIIGAGASGMMAAVTAARHGAKVTLLEHKNRIGKKILATGNGRCNLSNSEMSAERFHSDSRNIFSDIYRQFDLEATLSFFRSIGVEVLELDEGKLYPFSLQAASVLNVLRDELDRQNVAVICDVKIKSLEVGDRAKVITEDKNYYGDKLILATGGRSTPDLGSDGSGYRLAEALGHTVSHVYPSLIQLQSDYGYLKHLKGTKVMAGLKLMIDDTAVKSEYGELLFTDYGISGPPVLQISREASKALSENKNMTKVQVIADLVPSLSDEKLDDILLGRIESMPYKTMEHFFVGLLPKQLIVPLIKDNGMDMSMKAANITRADRSKIQKWLKAFTLNITGTRQWNQSQVTAGGVDCSEVDPVTLASTLHPNLFLCGELLDMDGDCGGFNLQWAWSSGYIAGLNAASTEEKAL